MYIQEIMTVDVHSVTPDTCLAAMRDIFSQAKYHHLLVIEETHLCGVVSDRDVLRMSSPTLDKPALDGDEINQEDEKLLARPAAELMTTHLITARPDTMVDTAAILLLENNISCLPVVNDDGTVAGIVTWKDMLKYYVYVC